MDKEVLFFDKVRLYKVIKVLLLFLKMCGHPEHVLWPVPKHLFIKVNQWPVINVRYVSGDSLTTVIIRQLLLAIVCKAGMGIEKTML